MTARKALRKRKDLDENPLSRALRAQLAALRRAGALSPRGCGTMGADDVTGLGDHGRASRGAASAPQDERPRR